MTPETTEHLGRVETAIAKLKGLLAPHGFPDDLRTVILLGTVDQLIEHHAIEYKRRGNAVATDERLAQIAKVPKREFMRRGINQHTLEKICKQEPVRAIKLAKCLKVIGEYED